MGRNIRHKSALFLLHLLGAIFSLRLFGTLTLCVLVVQAVITVEAGIHAVNQNYRLRMSMLVGNIYWTECGTGTIPRQNLTD